MKDKVNEIKISYCEKLGVIDSEPLTDSEKTTRLLYQNWDKGTIGLHETFKVLLLNNANKVKGIYQVSMGGLMGTVVDLRLLYAVALKGLAAGLILSHNHPSGSQRPSGADEKLTQKIKKAGELFDIKVLDHLIIMPDGKYFSFSDNGIL